MACARAGSLLAAKEEDIYDTLGLPFIGSSSPNCAKGAARSSGR
jgi:hypothetical protein